jgi:hypothetical protein
MKCSLSEHLKSPDYVPPRDLFRLVKIVLLYLDSNYLPSPYIQILTISSGLAYLHSLKVVHGDINLVCGLHYMQVRLTDTSLSGEYPSH